jgi:hypothetical protein
MNYNFCLRSNLITSTEVKLSLWSKQQLNKASTRVLGHLGHFLGICSTWTLHDFCCRIHLESFGKSCKVWLMICNFIHLMVQFQHLGSHWNKDMTYHFMWLFDSKLHETFPGITIESDVRHRKEVTSTLTCITKYNHQTYTHWNTKQQSMLHMFQGDVSSTFHIYMFHVLH